ncbi:MAG: ankyrin repeat domain-containing protein [Synergistaceae bacterium]|jgi:hypothetical protein|nr:ankyrin repeat domain-containing protein [Synergistaceae bacterium]
MKFLTDFLQRLKLGVHRPAEVAENEKTESSESSKGAEVPEDASARPKRRTKLKIIVGVWAAVGVVLLGFVLWRVLFAKPVTTAQTQVRDAELPPLSAAEKELFLAIRNDDVDAVRRCLSLGATLNARDVTGVTPVRVAIALNRTEVVRALLDGGYEDFEDASASLIYAIVQNRPEITREFLKPAVKKGTAGEIVNRVDKNGYTPLMYAIDRNHVAVARELLNGGADVNEPGKEGYTPLMMAATVGKADMVAVLLKAGADLNAVSRKGETAMSIARRRNKQVVVSLLQDAGSLPLQKKEML